jgi:peptidoglycan-N-acetylmuramic acid deacetylase
LSALAGAAAYVFGPGTAFAYLPIGDEYPEKRYRAPATVPTATPTAVPTVLPTATPTAVPTATPMSLPTATPKASSSPYTDKVVDFLSSHELRQGDSARKIVMMTYDDQMNTGANRTLGYILDTYKKHRARGTFFFNGLDWSGNGLSAYSETIKRIVDEGHTFGSHTWLHNPCTKMRTEEVRTGLEKWLEAAKKIVPSYEVKFVRFPYGDRNGAVLKEAAKLGLQSVYWTFGSWGEDPGTLNRVLAGVRETPSPIVLSHMRRTYDVDQCDEILGSLIREGYSPVSIEDGISPSDRRS